MPTATPTVPPIYTPTVPPVTTPTPSLPPGVLQQCAPVSYTNVSAFRVQMNTATSGATIFYTTDGTTPTHNGSTPTGTTQVYQAPVPVGPCGEKFFEAIAYKLGMADSDVTTHDARWWNGACGVSPGGGGSSVIVFSVWDGDWAILEEYNASGTRTQAYVQGYHGLVKTIVDNIYYYQDELGSTSHVANASGTLIEYYKYDLYGKPTYYDANGNQLTATAYNVVDLGDGGARWIPQLGLYDDRNRFMSPDLGRFLQPDPIGFKGDASNLYRYCGNDWANRTDPSGLIEVEIVVRAFIQQPVVLGFHGDGRGFSESSTASSRVSVTARIETDPAKNRGQVMVGTPKINISPTTPVIGSSKTATGPMLPQVTGFRDKNGNTGITVQENVRNPFQPILKGIRESVSVSVNQNATQARGLGTVSAAPSHEAVVTPTGGASTKIPLSSGPTGSDFASQVRFGIDLQRTKKVDTGQVPLNRAAGLSNPPQASNTEPGGEGFVALGPVLFGTRAEAGHLGGQP